MINPFAPNAFSLVSMSQAINSIPNMFGRVNELGLFTPEPITTTMVSVEEMSGVLNLVPSRPRGAPASQNISGKRTLRAFEVPHFPLEDVVLPGDVQNIRAFGSDNQLENVASVYARKLQEMRNKHAITLEHLRVKALQGAVLDADGSTLFNWFTEFGVNQTSVQFLMNTSTTPVRAKCAAVVRAIELALKGELMTGVRALCSPGFFDALIEHPNVQKAYANWSAAAQAIGGDNRKGFPFGGIMFEEYNGSATEADGTSHLFVPADEAIAFPVGTGNVFRTVQAPGNFLESANTPGLEMYARGVVRTDGRGVDILTEMNVLPICKRPALLVKLLKNT